MSLRWALLGTSRIGRSVVPRMQDGARHDLVAVASRSEDRARAYAAEWRIPRAYGSYEELLAAPDIDAVYIPLPNSLHAEWTIAAVRAGKHVLCEKPLALSLHEVHAVSEAARATGRVVAEAFMYRHHAQTLRVKSLIDEGAVGKVRVVRGAFAFWLSREEDVRLHPALGGGALWDVGCYPVSFARFMLGEEPVEAIGMADAGPTGVDLTFAGQLRFGSGAILQFDCSFRTDFRVLMEFVGAEGTLVIPNPFKPREREQLVLRRGDRQQTIDVTGGPLYLGELDDMADAVEQGKPPRVSLAESRANIAALVALLESARTGRVASLGGP